MFDRNEYLARIGFVQRDGESGLERFIRLHRCHSLTVPFENFNPFCGTGVSLSLDDIFEKVVRRRRGGYCFELNLLFQELLKDFGYGVKPIFCRPFSGEGVKLPLTHRMTLVTLEGKTWLADVGLGGNGWIDPLLLEPDREQTQWGRTYRIIQDPDMGFVVQLKRGEQYAMAVAFDTQAAEESDFVMSNHYTSTHPASPFVNRMMCTLPTLTGRYTIRDTGFRAEREGQVTQLRLEPHNFRDVLSRYFDLTLTEEMNEYISGVLSNS